MNEDAKKYSSEDMTCMKMFDFSGNKSEKTHAIDNNI